MLNRYGWWRIGVVVGARVGRPADLTQRAGVHQIGDAVRVIVQIFAAVLAAVAVVVGRGS